MDYLELSSFNRRIVRFHEYLVKHFKLWYMACTVFAHLPCVFGGLIVFYAKAKRLYLYGCMNTGQEFVGSRIFWRIQQVINCWVRAQLIIHKEIKVPVIVVQPMKMLGRMVYHRAQIACFAVQRKVKPDRPQKLSPRRAKLSPATASRWIIGPVLLLSSSLNSFSFPSSFFFLSFSSQNFPH